MMQKFKTDWESPYTELPVTQLQLASIAHKLCRKITSVWYFKDCQYLKPFCLNECSWEVKYLEHQHVPAAFKQTFLHGGDVYEVTKSI